MKKNYIFPIVLAILLICLIIIIGMQFKNKKIQIIVNSPANNSETNTPVVNTPPVANGQIATNNVQTNTSTAGMMPNGQTTSNTPPMTETIPSTVVIDYSNTEKGYFKTYLTNNLSTLSPEKEVLGGKFYITKLTWLDNQTAVFEYEDGHVAFKAEARFGFNNKERTDVKVESFKMLPLK